ncbi:putative oxidoreductase [Camellia lanceoleosa]|uniref:Oxidoreductase n=1 Tax=Camellia lanceoleosa TaxID=1840588 RepID=A0ACC0FRE9_9ERIC|nr:putative oxidoreductase [Camellia lanceoleosa]
MGATMWMHHPRTAAMREVLSDGERVGQLKTVLDRRGSSSPYSYLIPQIHSNFSFIGGPDFLTNNIRGNPDLDSLGALGDIGWYCTRAILWAANFQLPKPAVALRQPVLSEAGVILSCGSSLYWEDGKIATFHCSFLTNLSTDLTALGTKSIYESTTLPFLLKNVASFHVTSQFGSPMVSERSVECEVPQEALMVREFANLVAAIMRKGSKPEEKWMVISRKTQLVLDAVKASIERGFEPVEVVSPLESNTSHQ